ncbi:hypothetical protein LCGC14_1726570 [marine sediment metagenome]|uniref:Uncharacterized protein n=1 Tax=marine sediment metagenome TaxID=412755 RepID=A0A0F9HAV3_9ZZZZ
MAYIPPSLSSYNASPPNDDGSQVDSNALRWSNVVTKIGNPLKTFAEAINTAVKNRFDFTPDYSKTDAETAADATIVAGKKEPGNVVRYENNITPGTTDMSTAIIDAHSIGVHVTYKDEAFLFKGTTNPDFTYGVTLQNASVVGTKAEDKEIMVFDDGRLVGLQHNHLELDETEIGSNAAITQGVLVSPPISRADIQSDIDIIAHWWQDFGLEYTRFGNGSNGNLKWYYWDWNHTDTVSVDGFRNDRRPLLGWYRGDDAIVLDWQCYWLREYGIRVVSLLPTARVDVSTWATPEDQFHWLFQLVTNVPNFQGLRYLWWGPFDGAGIQTQWEAIVDDIHTVYDNFYAIEIGGKQYPAMYCFEEDTLYTNLGGTDAAYISFCTAIADKFIALGYAGVALFVRHMKSEATVDRRDYEAVNCYHFAMDYGAHGSRIASSVVVPVVDDASTMAAMVNSWTPYQDKPAWVVSTSYVVGDLTTNRRRVYRSLTIHTSAAADEPGFGKNWKTDWARLTDFDKEIASVATSKYATDAHPSNGNNFWKADGATPAIFRKWLNKAIDLIRRHDLPKIVAVYNVSEPAEGGPGLQPNSADGFGYLEAVRQALAESSVSSKPLTPTPDTNRRVNYQFVGATTPIDGRYDEVILHTDANRTMTATPTIKPGTHGQKLRLSYQDISSSNSVVIQDNATLANSDLFLIATTLTLSNYDSVELTFDKDRGGWIQTGVLVNVL